MQLNIKPKFVTDLDPAFVPAALWNREYRRLAASGAGKRRIALTFERANGTVSRYDTEILGDSAGNRMLNYRYVERIVKFLLWARGGWKITVAGAGELADMLAEDYSPSGRHAFDCRVIGRQVYGHDLKIEKCAFEDAPAAKETAVKLGGHTDGCRIGFDLGGSDRKCAAVIDGECVHCEEVVWNPYFEKDINYHYEGILDSLRRAAAKLPHIDAIGGSAAGVYVDGVPKIASLFRGIPEEKFQEQVHPLFRRIADNFPGVPFVVLNDGEVTALAGAMSGMGNALLGVSMGTSEAGGFVTPDGTLTDHLNELAFSPVDYREDNPVKDEWSGECGAGACFLSQQALRILAKPAGFSFAADMPLPEQLKAVQAAMAAGDARAERIYRALGIYLGYSVAHYADFYPLRNLLLLGRVSSGAGGELALRVAEEVLHSEFPELQIGLRVPDEKFKRLGQAMIAASLPELKH